MARKVRKVGDNEITPYQGNYNNSATARSERQRQARAQSRKRTQVRRNEEFEEIFGPYLYAIVIGAIVVMGIVAIALS